MPATVTTEDALNTPPATQSIANARLLIETCLEAADERYGTNLAGTVNTRFDIKGNTLGQARMKGGVYSLRFNRGYLAEGWEEFVKDTIPHEVAHLVCYQKRELGKNHDAGWRRVCIELGGNGERLSNSTVKVAPGRKTKRYMYTTECGHTIELSSVRHGKIQKRGVVYTMQNGARITRECQYKRVA